MGFRFRHFFVEDQHSTMKVGTDAMLLGSWAEPPKTGHILDIGTGCGVLALMMALKTNGNIDAVELDPLSAAEARGNFLQSPWASRLRIIHADIRKFAQENKDSYDFIISNPPFFNRSLKSNRNQRNMARHEVNLSYRELAESVALLLNPQGRFSMIATADWTADFQKEASAIPLFPSRTLPVTSRPGKIILRILSEWSFRETSLNRSGTLTMLKTDGKYSEEYLALTREYHYFNY